LFFVLMFSGIIICRWLKSKKDPARKFCNASTQTDGPNDMTNRELDVIISTRLDCLSYPLSLEHEVVLRDNYNLRLEYKSVGAKYDGNLRRWFIRAGSDLRPILMNNPGWIEHPELVYRQSLFLAYHRTNDTEDLF
ncbi:MAG: hypothetical protein ACKPKO_45645, partial [Candidatus Fonsibacter sp.]